MKRIWSFLKGKKRPWWRHALEWIGAILVAALVLEVTGFSAAVRASYWVPAALEKRGYPLSWTTLERMDPVLEKENSYLILAPFFTRVNAELSGRRDELIRGLRDPEALPEAAQRAEEALGDTSELDRGLGLPRFRPSMPPKASHEDGVYNFNKQVHLTKWALLVRARSHWTQGSSEAALRDWRRAQSVLLLSREVPFDICGRFVGLASFSFSSEILRAMAARPDLADRLAAVRNERDLPPLRHWLRWGPFDRSELVRAVSERSGGWPLNQAPKSRDSLPRGLVGSALVGMTLGAWHTFLVEADQLEDGPLLEAAKRASGRNQLIFPSTVLEDLYPDLRIAALARTHARFVELGRRAAEFRRRNGRLPRSEKELGPTLEDPLGGKIQLRIEGERLRVLAQGREDGETLVMNLL